MPSQSSRLKFAVGSLVGAVAIHVVFVACGSSQMGGVPGGEEKDAHAADPDSGAPSGGCTCTVGPVSINGNVKAVTADTDLGQLVRIEALPTEDPSFHSTPKIVDGPLIVTSVLPEVGAYSNLWIDKKPDCSTVARSGFGVANLSGAPTVVLTGTRIPLAQGETLCGSGKGFLTVTGFKPY